MQQGSGTTGESLGAPLGRALRVFASTTSLPVVSRATSANPSDSTILVALPKLALTESVDENAFNGLLNNFFVEEWPGPKVSIIVDSLQDVRNNISELRDEVHALRASDTEKTASIATLNDEIATLNGEIATLNAKIERIIGVLGDRV